MRHVFAIAAILAGCSLAAEPFYVDFAKSANSSRFDDGIAGNRQGGWSDEGINDMFTYPPVPTGAVVNNNYKICFLDPAKGKDVIMLRRDATDTWLPKSVSADVPDVKGKYLYFYHNAVRDSGSKNGDTLAVYTVTYADGTKAEIPMIKGKQLSQWWAKQWWDNAEDQAWPVFAAGNAYTIKYGSVLMIWGTRWENPHPEKPISKIEFASCDANAAVAVWAATIDDEDYRADAAKNKGNVWGKPMGAPEEFFDARLEGENRAIYAEALKMGFIKGLYRFEFYRPDLVAVTVDPAWSGFGAVASNKLYLAKAVPENFTVSSSDDPAYASEMHPAKVGHQGFEYFNGAFGKFQICSMYAHTYFLKLARPMQSGKHYTFQVKGIPAGLRDRVELAYDDRKSETPVIKVNQSAYSSQAQRRYAYLGWWAGDMDAVDYSAFQKFEVLDHASGKTVLSGDIKFVEDKHKLSGEGRVGEMDLSKLAPGSYRVHVPGLGVSAAFEVGFGDAMKKFYYHTPRAFFHQRCGQELKEPFTSFAKPACHLFVDENGQMYKTEEEAKAKGKTVQKHIGGYHDAADFDTFTYHLRATAQQLDVYDLMTKYCTDDAWNIPESGNGIPDVLDEAEWALRWYKNTMAADGGVHKGRCNDQDSRRQRHLKWGAFGLFQPDPISNYEFAATAASFSRLIRKYDAKKADEYLDAAKRAFAWAKNQPLPPPPPPPAPGKRARKPDTNRTSFSLWAAAALYRAGAGNEYREFFDRESNGGKFRVQWNVSAWMPQFFWQYVRCELPVDEEVRTALKTEIVRRAQNQIEKQLDAEPYRSCARMSAGVGFGTGIGGGFYADTQLRAWALTSEQKYLDAACLNADFLLGCNPLSKTFVTQIGSRSVEHPQIAPYLYNKPGRHGIPLTGMTVYGLCTNRKIGRGWLPEPPPMRRWRDMGNGGAELYNEFTVPESTGHTAMLAMALRAIENGYRPSEEFRIPGRKKNWKNDKKTQEKPKENKKKGR